MVIHTYPSVKGNVLWLSLVFTISYLNQECSSKVLFQIDTVVTSLGNADVVMSCASLLSFKYMGSTIDLYMTTFNPLVPSCLQHWTTEEENVCRLGQA